MDGNGPEWKRMDVVKIGGSYFININDQFNALLRQEIDERSTKAVGETPEAAIHALVEAEGWGLVIIGDACTDLDDQYTWGYKFTVKSADFVAKGHKVPGGYVLTWWK